MDKELLEKKTNLLLGIFIAALIAANLLGSKVTTIFGIVTSVGIFAYPITFLITDIIEEVRGKKVTKSFIHAGLFALILTLILVAIGIVMPPASFYQSNEAYKTIFQNSMRVIIASITAFLISQYHDIWAFNFLKKKTKKKHLWLRNNLSTSVSQLIDTTIFIFIAFYATTPQYTVIRMIQMIIPYWTLKVLFAVVDTPLVYLGVKWIRSDKRKSLTNSKN
ncbi:transporter [Candidatus Woesearchaeota archaeon B3_Woes]|nr:MAG: transporter [Candidatus Woesearchaeota archaeon B3_Woes]